MSDPKRCQKTRLENWPDRTEPRFVAQCVLQEAHSGPHQFMIPTTFQRIYVEKDQ